MRSNRGAIDLPGAIGLGGDPALLGGAIENGKVELLFGGVESGKKVEYFVDHFDVAFVRAIDLVDHDDRLQPDLERLGQHKFGLRHRPLGGIDEKHGAVDHIENAFDLAAEIGMARSVDDVDARRLAIEAR